MVSFVIATFHVICDGVSYLIPWLELVSKGWTLHACSSRDVVKVVSSFQLASGMLRDSAIRLESWWDSITQTNLQRSHLHDFIDCILLPQVWSLWTDQSNDLFVELRQRKRMKFHDWKPPAFTSLSLQVLMLRNGYLMTKSSHLRYPSIKRIGTCLFVFSYLTVERAMQK